MLPTHIHEMLREQVDSDLLTKGTELNALVRQAIYKNLANGGGLHKGVHQAQAYLAEIKLRANLIVEAFRKVLSEIRIDPYPELVPDLVAFSEVEFDGLIQHWRPLVIQAWHQANDSSHISQGANDGGISNDITKWRTEFRTEIKRLGVSLLTAPKSYMANTYETHVHHSHGVQIGEGNIQNIAISLQQMLRAVDEGPGAPEEKKEVKSRLKSFLEHPLMATILGETAKAVIDAASK